MKIRECLFLTSGLILMCIASISIVSLFSGQAGNSWMVADPNVRNHSTAAGSSDPIDDEWPMFHGSLNHTGAVNTTPAQDIGPLWINATGNIIAYSSPAVAGDRLYIGGDDTKLHCLNSTTGTSLWNYTTGGKIWSSPAVADDRVYVGSYDDKLHCVNATTGAFLWSYTTGLSWIISSPSVSNDRVYFGSNDHNVYCLNATTGSFNWSYPTTSYIFSSSPAIANGRVYIGSEDHKIYCLDAITGAWIWNYTTGGNIESSPTIAGGLVYVGSDDNKIYCLNASTGASIWNYTTGGSVRSSPAIANGHVYVGSLDYKIYCLDASTGAQLWNFTTGYWVYSSPAIAGDRLYVGSWDNKVYSLNSTTGTILWSYDTGNRIDSSPAIAGGKVYIGSYSQKIYCLPMVILSTSPWNLGGVGDIGQVTLSWQVPESDGGSPITGYKIYQGSNPGSETLRDTIGTVLTYIASGLTPGQVYSFFVTALNGNGESSPSNEVSLIAAIAPSGPQTLTALAGDGRVDLSWTPPANNGGSPVINYKIYRGTSSSSEVFSIMVANITAYTDTTTTNGQTYYFEVTAVTAAGEGLQSNEANALPIASAPPPYSLGGSTAPGAPTVLTASTGDNQIILTWLAPSSNGGVAIINYKIYRGTAAGGEVYLAVTMGNGTTYTDTNVTNGIVYYYKVSAVNSVGEGSLSVETSAAPVASGGVVLVYLGVLIAFAALTAIIAFAVHKRNKVSRV